MQTFFMRIFSSNFDFFDHLFSQYFACIIILEIAFFFTINNTIAITSLKTKNEQKEEEDIERVFHNNNNKKIGAVSEMNFLVSSS